MQLILWSAIVLLSVALDQISKYIVVLKLKPIGFHPFIEGLLGFRYAENTGAAFGMMKGFRWGFILLSSLAIVAIFVYLIKCRRKVPTLLGISLAMIAGGGIGNQIDRIANGFVVDFLEFQFVDFAIFNVADCFVTIGAVLILIDILFVDRDFLSDDEKKKKRAAAAVVGTGEAAENGASCAGMPDNGEDAADMPVEGANQSVEGKNSGDMPAEGANAAEGGGEAGCSGVCRDGSDDSEARKGAR